MVRPPKNIQWWWSPPKPLKISNGLLKTIENFQWSLKNHWNVQWFPKNHSTWLGLLKSMKFTVFSKKNGTFLWSQYYQSWLCLLKSSLPLPVVLNNHCRAHAHAHTAANQTLLIFETGSGLVIAHDFLMRRKNPAEFRLCPQCPAPQSSVGQPTYKINCAKHNAKWDICGQFLQFWGNKCCLFSVVLYVRLLGPIYVHLRALLEICILSRIDFTHFFCAMVRANHC